MNLYGLLDAIINKVNRAVKVEKQELDSSLQKQARENINAPSKNEVCNPNLLDNWYFGNPVNQRGQTKYSKPEWDELYSIDRWALAVASYNVQNKKLTALANYSRIIQRINDKSLIGQTVTFSVLISSVANTNAGILVSDGAGDYALVEGQAGIISTTFTVRDFGDTTLALSVLGITAGGTVVIEAVKLELGDTQTLAHQDSNGNWVLNEIPNYAEELLKCRQYDPYTGEYVGLRKFSQPRNLLDNSDFRNPVNQRGLTNYTTAGYTIDKWFTPTGSTTLTVNDSGVTISDGYFVQRIETKKIAHLSTLTFAMRLSNGLYMGSADISDTVVGNSANFYANATITLNAYRESEDVWQFYILSFETSPITIEWAALYEGEYTAETLPEYQPKGYAAELLICRQYDLYTGEYIGLRKFSQPQNLLDNSDFTNPVAQAGVNGKHGNEPYVVDRWKAINISAASVDNGLTLTTSNAYARIQQNISVVPGKTYTCAAKFDNAGYGSIAIYDTSIKTTYGIVSNIVGVGCVTFTVPAGVNTIAVLLYPRKTEIGSGTIYWAALYEGEYTIDTLPDYQPKGYGVELAECMRYYQTRKILIRGKEYNPDANYPSTIPITFTPMRIVPTFTLSQSWASNVYTIGVSEGTNTGVGINIAPPTAGLYACWSGDIIMSADL